MLPHFTVEERGFGWIENWLRFLAAARGDIQLKIRHGTKPLSPLVHCRSHPNI
jgi:hypothetical protein